MPIMEIGTNNLEEEMAAMKAMLEWLVKENEENEACIKLHEEKIDRLTRKLEKRPAWSLEKSSESEEEGKTFVQSKTFDEEVHSKKGNKLKNDGSPNLMTVEQIEDLIANVVKAQLGGAVHKTHLYTNPYTKKVDALICLVATNLQNSSNLTRRATQNSMWHILSRNATTLAHMTT